MASSHEVQLAWSSCVRSRLLCSLAFLVAMLDAAAALNWTSLGAAALVCLISVVDRIRDNCTAPPHRQAYPSDLDQAARTSKLPLPKPADSVLHLLLITILYVLAIVEIVSLFVEDATFAAERAGAYVALAVACEIERLPTLYTVQHRGTRCTWRLPRGNCR